MFEFKELSSTCDIVYGLSPKGIQSPDGTNYIYGTGGIVGKTNLSAFDSDSVVVPRKGSLSNPIFAEAGFWAIDTTFVAIPKAGYDAKWLYYHLDNYGLDSLNEATGVPSISRDRLSKVKIAVCSLDEQKRIAEILSAVDGQIETVQTEINKNGNTKNSLLRTHLESVGNVVYEGSIENALESLIDYRGKSPRKIEQGVPLITAKVVKDGRVLPPTEFIAEDNFDSWMTRGIPLSGDVLFTTEAPLGEVALAPDYKFALAQRLICLRGKKGILENTYLVYLLQTEGFERKLKAYSSGSTVTGIKQSEFRRIKIELPPVEKQEKIAQALIQVDSKIDALTESLVKLGKLKESLMNDLLTGKTRVPS